VNLAGFDACCAALTHASFVIQWHGSHVHKIGGKVFAIGSVGGHAGQRFTAVFKTSPLACEILLSQDIATRPAYLRRGNWVRLTENAVPDAEFSDYVAQSYHIIASKLPRHLREALSL
jgi:predicted DNA-binding protein (MmcQ/YjbR family)